MDNSIELEKIQKMDEVVKLSVEIVCDELKILIDDYITRTRIGEIVKIRARKIIDLKPKDFKVAATQMLNDMIMELGK